MSLGELFWFEKYRPKSFAEIVDLEEIKARLAEFIKAGNMPHLLFYGPPGTGKTTTALVLARELYGERWRENTLELNASDERGINVIRERVKEFARTAPAGGAPFKLVVLDEADNMTSDAQQALRRIMEMYAATTRFVLLANYVSRIIDPILSRCAVFRFPPMPKPLMAQRLQYIASQERIKLTEDGIDAIYEISQGDMRRAINLLQMAAASAGVVDKESVAAVASAAKPSEILEIFNLAFSGDVEKARERLRDLMYMRGIAGIDILKALQRELPRLQIDEETKAAVAELLADVDLRLVEGSDEELQLTYMLVKLAALGARARVQTKKR
ncbi:replication factor C small subunit [Thermoproteus tenax]|uniref:Replication factor C small subunit n=1 Tax=Thermoproteus tenax (strain ATCC 35583 / DSM 2078 / JCM 9277 / NBRC 100435 / Kra 1) TaxID=768679 RepID=G4RLM4_THETK|nr:replication factor C small subunit [Thermoproteus tenax]CCC82469.1 replication factor C small subunit [Thermoproteus tenax Kra 1]